tara:strand:- start:56 stop:376 length:321 start_codon:yes stop_codon:yes gene_type:complete
MTKYQHYRKIMNSQLRKYSEEELKLLWDDWHCEHDLFKRTIKELGFNQNDRQKLIKAMDKLGIEEVLNLSGVNFRVYPLFFSEETKAMFATMQNQIATKREYRVYE